MCKSSALNVNWHCRIGLAIVCLHIFAAASWTAEQLIDEAVIRKWEAYERFARSLQGTARITNITSGSGGERKGRTQLVWKQNQNCISSSTSGDSNPTMLIRISNPQYDAYLKRSKSNPSEVVLDRFFEANQRPKQVEGAIFEANLKEISPHFYVAQETPLSRILVDPQFKILKISKKSTNGRELVQMEYRVVRDGLGARREYSGTVDLDPSRCWCIVRKKEERKLTQKRRESAVDSVVEVEHETIDHTSGFPLVKSSTGRSIQQLSDNGKKTTTETRSKIDFEWEVNDHVPDSEFTLAAFGLPEAGSEPVKKSLPLYVWIIVAAGVSFGLAVGFRFLARRRASPQTTK